jgi:hypothetical protein
VPRLETIACMSPANVLPAEHSRSALVPTTGKATAAVLVADDGDAHDYPSARAYWNPHRGGHVGESARQGEKFPDHLGMLVAVDGFLFQ